MQEEMDKKAAEAAEAAGVDVDDLIEKAKDPEALIEDAKAKAEEAKETADELKDNPEAIAEVIADN